MLRTIAAVTVTTLTSLLAINVTPAQPQAQLCAATTTPTIADKIANGHSWGKHSSEFVAGTVIAGLTMPASPKVTNVAEFKALIQSVMGSTVNKALSNGRKAYWTASTGTFVVYDPNSVDCGTAFRPTDGKPYYDRQN